MKKSQAGGRVCWIERTSTRSFPSQGRVVECDSIF